MTPVVPVLPIQLGFRGPSEPTLPAYTGGLWRSALGQRMRRRACITGAPTCKDCSVGKHCGYGDQFETPPTAGRGQLSARYPEPPHPYVLSPHRAQDEGDNGRRYTLDLILIGRAANYLPDWLAVTRSVELDGVTLSRESLALCPPRQGADPEAVTPAQLLDAKPQLPATPAPPQRARLRVRHPLRLRRRNKYLGPDHFDFPTFFNTLTRRASMLYEVEHCQSPREDFRQLAAQAQRVVVEVVDLSWFEWSRYSARQRRRIPMDGVVGSITISGDLAPVWPWLWLGQWLHVGKGAVMGLGRYRLEMLD